MEIGGEKLLTGGGDWSSWGFSEDFCIFSIGSKILRYYNICDSRIYIFQFLKI